MKIPALIAILLALATAGCVAQNQELTGSLANQPIAQTATLRKGETFAHIEVQATLANTAPASKPMNCALLSM